MKSRVLKCARHYVINHTCQACGPRSRKLSLSAVACFSPVSDFLSFLLVFWSSVCVWVCFWVIFLFSQAATSLPPTIPHVSADKRWGITKHVGHMLAEITHTEPPSNISQGRRKGCIHHSDRARMERDIPLLSTHTHMHCRRFIVQGFNGALTHLSHSVYLSHKHTSIHHSSPCFPPLLCRSFICCPTSPFSFLSSISPFSSSSFPFLHSTNWKYSKIKMSKSGSVQMGETRFQSSWGWRGV